MAAVSGVEGPPSRPSIPAELLAPPSTATANAAAPPSYPRIARPSPPYACNDERFLLRDRNYADQYAATYYCRLAACRPSLTEAAQKRWPGVPVKSVLDLEEGQECAVVGTIYKEQAAKPSALDAAAAAAKGGATSGSAASAPAGANIDALAGGIPSLASPRDALVLEDAGARVALSSSSSSSPSSGTGDGGDEKKKKGAAAGAASGSRGGPLPAGPLVTGVVVALRGRVNEDGAFEVADALFRGPGAPPPPRDPAALASSTSMPMSSSSDASTTTTVVQGDPYVALVSGLGSAAAARLGGSGDGDSSSSDVIDLAAAASASLAADLLSGLAGAGDDAALFARVARVVVAGGLVPPVSPEAVAHAAGGGAAGPAAAAAGGGGGGKAGAAAAAAAARTALGGPLRDADALALSLASSVPLDVMPGLPDPTGHALPQQPLHACLLPGAASRYGSSSSSIGGGRGGGSDSAPKKVGTLVRATNPHDFELGGVRFLGTSGQNVDDVLRWSTLGLKNDDDGALEEPSAKNVASIGDGARRCEALKSLLRWGHLAPTAPDTLAAFPFKSRDPFVMEPGQCPHVFFCGGGREFATATAVVGKDGRVVDDEEGAGAEKATGASSSSTVRLVSVPDFAASPVIVLVNLRTLECHPVRVQA